MNFNRIYTSGRLQGGKVANLRLTVTVDLDTLQAVARDMTSYATEDGIDALTRAQVEEHLRDAVFNGCLTEAAGYHFWDNNSEEFAEKVYAKVAELFPEAVPTV